MKCKKLLALVLAMVMILSVLAGCNTEQPTGTTEGKDPDPQQTTPAPTDTTEDNTINFPLEEPITITVDALLPNTAYPLKDNVAWNYLQELSGFVFETTEVPSSEYKEKMGLVMNGGEYSEVLFKMSGLDLNKYGMDGLLLPLEDMIREYMPTLTAILDERDGWDTISASDGHVYSLPTVNFTTPNVNTGMTWFINQKWLDNLGLEMPTTLDELYNVLKAFKEKDPNGNGIADEIPLSAYATHTSYWALMGLFDTGLQYADLWHVVDGEMEYAPTNAEYFKEYLNFWKKLYDEGLVNNDLFTQEQDQWKGVAGSSTDVIYGMQWNSNCAIFDHIDPQEKINWTAIKPSNPDNYALANGISGGGLALTDKCQNPEVILAFFDYLYTEEGGQIVSLGKVGVTTVINEDGTFTRVGDYESVAYQVGLTGAGNYPARVSNLSQQDANPAARHNKNEWNGEGYGIGQVGVIMPKISLTTEENEEYSVLHTDIKAYVRNYIAEVVTGKQDLESTWEDFQKALEEMGVDRMVEIYSAAYERAAG